MSATLEDLYAAHPELYAAEHDAEHRVEERREILELLRPGTLGAELGVFTGLFSEVLLETVRPSVLHLVDPWWLAYGERYPDWREYTNHGRLETRTAHAATVARVEASRGTADVQIHVATSTAWLQALPDHSLDWVYLDSTHYYKDTLRELRALQRKIRHEGLVLGDDWRPHPAHPHHGVFRAVHREVRAGAWDVVRVDRHAQWAIRPAARYPRGGRYRQALTYRARRLLGRA